MFAYIPARSGSVRIKNKNIKTFYGKPILEITIHNLQKLKIINQIFVSTDSTKIKKIAEKSGAKVLELRKKELSNSKSGTMDLIKYDIPRYCKYQNDKNVLFKRNFAGEIMKKYNLKLVDYGFCWKDDKKHYFEDTNWFLFKK